MKVLVVGSGGREHALAWKLKQSPKVTHLYIAPGNPGTKALGENIEAKTKEEILNWLRSNPMDLVVIGPDQFLAEGLTDAIQELGIAVFGPTKAAAKIEWSKSYAKQLMEEVEIPTSAYKAFRNSDEARAYIRTQKLPIVLKADGLAAGKGVVIATSFEQADVTIKEMLEDAKFGESGKEIVVEEYLEGFEISVHAFCDGEDAVLFPASKDHKRIFDGDKGSNTGGMGTIAPVPGVSVEQMTEIQEKIVRPLLAALKERGRTFEGILFPGIMLTADGPKVIEFNARFGDPETQSYMLLLESDLFDILYACTNGTLAGTEILWRDEYACCIILAAEGYPDAPKKGSSITLPESNSKDFVIFHAGTALEGSNLVVSGGRVLGVAARGESLTSALDVAYSEIEGIHFTGMQYRKDIGDSKL